MKTKKILIIENRPDYGLGGVEKYNSKLIEIIKSNYENIIVDKCYLLNSFNKVDSQDKTYFYTKHTNFISKLEKKNKLFYYLFIGFHIFFFRKKVYKLEKINNYDLIIDSTVTYFSKLKNNDNFIWVQHVTPEFYKHKYIKNKFLRLLINFGKSCFFLKNPTLKYKNIVCFDEENANQIKKQRNDNFNLFKINLFSKIYEWNKIENNLSKRDKIVFFGRIEDSQKNIFKLININKKINFSIDFYGFGAKKIINELGTSYKGIIKNNLFETISKYKYAILLSKYEGFPFSFVQALSSGIPIISNNTFASARFLINNNKNGYLLENDLNNDDIANRIKNILNDKNLESYYKQCRNSWEFAKNNLSETQFEDKWIELLNKYIN